MGDTVKHPRQPRQFPKGLSNPALGSWGGKKWEGRTKRCWKMLHFDIRMAIKQKKTNLWEVLSKLSVTSESKFCVHLDGFVTEWFSRPRPHCGHVLHVRSHSLYIRMTSDCKFKSRGSQSGKLTFYCLPLLPPLASLITL